MREYRQNRDELIKVADFLEYKKIKYEMYFSDGKYCIEYELDEMDDDLYRLDKLVNEWQQFIRRKKIEGILND